jgi:hypothetical protein
MVHGLNVVPVPQNIDDAYLQTQGEGQQPAGVPSQLGLFVYSCTLLDILRHVLQFVASWEPGADVAAVGDAMSQRETMIIRVLEMNGQLDNFLSNLPDYLATNESDLKMSSADGIGLQKQILRCR